MIWFWLGIFSAGVDFTFRDGFVFGVSGDDMFGWMSGACVVLIGWIGWLAVAGGFFEWNF